MVDSCYTRHFEDDQRIIEKRLDWNLMMLPPPGDLKLMVTNIPEGDTVDELFCVGKSAGDIFHVRLMIHPGDPQRHTGCGFVRYYNADAVRRAQHLFLRVGYKMLEVVDSKKLMLFSNAENSSRKSMEVKISVAFFTPENVVMYKHAHYELAVVTYFSSHQVNVIWVLMEDDEYLKIKFYDEDLLQRIKSVTVLYVHSISFQISEGYLLYLFSLQGCLPVYKVKKLRDFAFVHYFTRHDAEVALCKLNGFNLNGSCIEVTWAKPPEKHDKANCFIQPKPLNPQSCIMRNIQREMII